MPEFVVHNIPGSPFGRSVLAALEEKNVPWRMVRVPHTTMRQSPHIERHPFGRVPVLEHGDFQLYETQAILRYIDRVLPEPPLAPMDPHRAAQMDLVMNVTDWYLFQGVGNVIVFQRLLVPHLLGGVPDEAAIAAAMPNAKTVFAELARLLGDKPFMTGNAFTLADIHAACQMATIAATPEWATLTADHGNLVAWLARVEARPSFLATTWQRLSEMAPAS